LFMYLKKLILLSICLWLTSNKLTAQSIGGIASGSASYCDTINSGFVSISGYVGNVTTWQFSVDGGANWANNFNSFTTQSYFGLKQSTCYRAIVQNGSFPPDTSTIVCITIYTPTKGGLINGGGTFCFATGAGTLNLLGSIGNVINWQSSTNNGSSWTVITNTTTSLSYTNITQNTLYMATVQNGSFCKVDTSSVASFTINPLSNAGTISYTGNDTICYNANNGTLNLTGYVGNVVNWISSINNGTSWSVISNPSNSLIYSGLTQTTWYKAIVQSANCPADTSTYQAINVLLPFTVSAGNDTTISLGQSITLNGSGSGSPLWSSTSNLSNATIFNPTTSPLFTSTYILSVTDINSCINADTVVVTVIVVSTDISISTVFSPNGDGINDNWFIKNISIYPENEVTVFNIYGNEVFHKKGYNNDWQGTYNGNSLPDGTYFYIVKTDGISVSLKGSLDILRK
jgi:gliding motility-associated-like protein